MTMRTTELTERYAVIPRRRMNARRAYLDNLKIVLVVGVIAVHAAITYGFDGSWYLESYDEMDDRVVALVTVPLGIGWLFGLKLTATIASEGRATGLVGVEPSAEPPLPGESGIL